MASKLSRVRDIAREREKERKKEEIQKERERGGGVKESCSLIHTLEYRDAHQAVVFGGCQGPDCWETGIRGGPRAAGQDQTHLSPRW